MSAADLLRQVEAAGGTVTVSGGRLRLRAPAPLPPALQDALRHHKVELVALLGGVHGKASPAAPAPADIPPAWIEGVTKLAAMPCPAGIAPGDWRVIVAGIDRLLNDGWGAKLADLGWDTMAVFGCHADVPLGRLDQAGLAVMLIGREVVAVSAEVATLRTRSGALQTVRRQAAAEPKRVAIWDLGEA